MMPDYTFQSAQNGKRAGVIAADLLRLDYDILCFEKVFSTAGRHTLARALAKRYPYQYGPANSGWSLKTNSGVWVVSQFPLADYHQIQFRASAGLESFARKGALMLTGTFQGHRFHLVTAHLQGEDGSEYTEAHQRVRERQLMQIRDELLGRYAQPGVPIFLCGDFNTPRRDPKEPARDSDAYGAMLRLLGNPQNGEADRLTLEDMCDRNDLAMENSGRSAELDYILIKPGSSPIDAQHSRLVFLHPGWDGRTLRQNLSYRHAVAMEATFR
jgi:endonuclease/exonuclease/phosphatase family metal-dependent hydrolase